MFGIKSQNKYYKIKKLPQGWSDSPYLMQRLTLNIISTILLA